jgi:hypothetical protein
MHTIEILEHTETKGANDSPDLAQEEKLSSSDIRRSMLGSFRQPQVCYFTVCIAGNLVKVNQMKSSVITTRFSISCDCVNVHVQI